MKIIYLREKEYYRRERNHYLRQNDEFRICNPIFEPLAKKGIPHFCERGRIVALKI